MITPAGYDFNANINTCSLFSPQIHVYVCVCPLLYRTDELADNWIDRRLTKAEFHYQCERVHRVSLGARSQSLVHVLFLFFLSAHFIHFALLRTCVPNGKKNRTRRLVDFLHRGLTRVSFVCGRQSVARSGITSSWVCSALSPNTDSLCFHRCSTSAAAAFFNTLIPGYRASLTPAECVCVCLSCKGLEAWARVAYRSQC